MSAEVAREAPAFTEEHSRALLGLLVSLDPRLRAADEHTAKVRIGAWARLLGEVDPGWAVRWCELAYQEVRDFAVQPGEILQAWRLEQRERALEAGEALVRPPEGDGPEVSGGLAGNPAMLDWLREAWAVGAAGGDVASVPRPAWHQRTPTAAQLAWERRCTFFSMCACDHTVCRDGWLDEPVFQYGTFGRYEKVERCPHCYDAVVMAIERGIAKRPSDRPRRRAS